MTNRDPEGLFTDADEVARYENQYDDGYMEEYWSDEHKRRITEVVAGLDLADRGEVLDFGCGDGQITDTLRNALPPGWNVTGTDLSQCALAKAKRDFPGCTFADGRDAGLAGRRFDLLFSNHVLEHVLDLEQTVSLMGSLTKKDAAMLHALPCGNPGSLEHAIASMTRDGIDPSVGNRFFFETKLHVRRLTTDQMAQSMDSVGFRLVRSFFENHHHGGIDWTTAEPPAFVLHLANPKHGVGLAAQARLAWLLLKLYPISMLRNLAVRSKHAPSSATRSSAETFLSAAHPVLKMLATRVENHLARKARKEWETRRDDPRASAMFLYFTRGGAAGDDTSRG